jgi:hypothetical protein
LNAQQTSLAYQVSEDPSSSPFPQPEMAFRDAPVIAPLDF